MSATVYAAGYVTGGSVTITIDPLVALQLRELGDGPIDAEFRRFKRNRSTQANNYYWGRVLLVLSEHTGHTRDELHEICRAKFLPKDAAVCDRNGEVVDSCVIGGSTAKLDVDQFARYVDAIRAWALEKLGCVIPEAGA